MTAHAAEIFTLDEVNRLTIYRLAAFDISASPVRVLPRIRGATLHGPALCDGFDD